MPKNGHWPVSGLTVGLHSGGSPCIAQPASTVVCIAPGHMVITKGSGHTHLFTKQPPVMTMWQEAPGPRKTADMVSEISVKDEGRAGECCAGSRQGAETGTGVCVGVRHVVVCWAPKQPQSSIPGLGGIIIT